MLSYLTEWCCKKAFFTAIQVRTVSICQIELSTGSVQGNVSICAVVAHGFDNHLTDCFTNLSISCLSKLNNNIPIENAQKWPLTFLSFPGNLMYTTYINSDEISCYVYKSVGEKSKLNNSDYKACDIKKFSVRASAQLIDERTLRISYGIIPGVPNIILSAERYSLCASCRRWLGAAIWSRSTLCWRKSWWR